METQKTEPADIAHDEPSQDTGEAVRDIEISPSPESTERPDRSNMRFQQFAPGPNVQSPSSTEVVKVKTVRAKKRPKKYILKEDYIDIIKDTFWESKPWILA